MRGRTATSASSQPSLRDGTRAGRLGQSQQRRLRRILAAAVALAERGGFEAVRLRDVAQESEVALGTLYKYFHSKEDILLLALAEEVERLEAAMVQHPLGLYPLVIDGRRRLITSTIPRPRGAHRGEGYFARFLRFLHAAWPALRDEKIALEAYWTGMTSNSSSVYREDYPKLYRVDDGVIGLRRIFCARHAVISTTMSSSGLRQSIA